MDLTLDKPDHFLTKYGVKASINGNVRRTSWLFKRAKYIDCVKTPANENAPLLFANQMDSMITVLNAVYKENWDFFLKANYYSNGPFKNYSLYLLIHYPKIEIRNSRGTEHTIKDLYIISKLEDSLLSVGEPVWAFLRIYGLRSTFSVKEVSKGYHHSHLPVHHIEENLLLTPYEFCLGSPDADIYQAINDLTLEYDPLVFEMFLWTLDSIVHWESIEGVAYISIGSLVEHNETITISGYRAVASYYATQVSSIMPFLDYIDFEYTYSNGRYKIKDTQEFREIVKDIIITTYPEHASTLLVTEVVSDNLSSKSLYGFQRRASVSQILQNTQKSFNFRDKTIKFELEDSEGEVDITKYEVNPYFIEKLIDEIEKELYKKAVIRSGVEKYNSLVSG